ncbi:RNA polymerase nonessential primary-like sigma factor [Natronocella acetinitrilica]|uniref:RNA polymerase nonessential primary-like sigma factor n=1 Tax=Natronocella acetinitrilica TaxID=414046 RepID=A0AAE3G4D8_9GAMM|nr:sigma-70 family RNA polymerase sigma factor [Natronocella acetinitrilica]MCP1674173.1 RNA polymerase nonessential primary-like sigma factor [Natronocella acetinitrilica]
MNNKAVTPSNNDPVAAGAAPRHESLDSEALYSQQVRNIDVLSREEQLALVRRAQGGDAAAREAFLEANLRLVMKVARDYSHTPLPYMDLVSEGNFGLMRAAELFDPEAGFAFSTYAVSWIRYRIERALQRQSLTVHVPCTTARQVAKANNTRRRLQGGTDGPVKTADVAAAMGVDAGQAEHLLAISECMSSLDVPLGEGSAERVVDAIADQGADVLFELDSADQRRVAEIALAGLDDRTRTAVVYRFGLGGGDPMTLAEIADVIGVTRERVRQMVAAALPLMAQRLVEAGIEPEDVLCA